MRYKFSIFLLMTALAAEAQIASHATNSAQPAQPAASSATAFQLTDKPVAKVNGAVLTDRDLLREMLAIFPYAGQHNGFPKAQEASIRQGALEMIIFEELVYQEAGRRRLTVSPERISHAEAEFRKQFHSPDEYQQYLQMEMHGSRQVLRKRIERSLLIEQVLKTDVDDKSAVSLAEIKAFYDKNPARFEKPESFDFQSISILPPPKPTADAISQKPKACRRHVAPGPGYEDLSGIWAAGRKNLRRRFPREYGGSQERQPRQIAASIRESCSSHASRTSERRDPD